MESVSQKLKEIVAEQLQVNVDDIQEDSFFKDDLGVDSFVIIRLILEIEDEFEIGIPVSDAERITVFQGMVDYIINALAQDNMNKKPCPTKLSKRSS